MVANSVLFLACLVTIISKTQLNKQKTHEHMLYMKLKDDFFSILVHSFCLGFP